MEAHSVDAMCARVSRNCPRRTSSSRSTLGRTGFWTSCSDGRSVVRSVGRWLLGVRAVGRAVEVGRAVDRRVVGRSGGRGGRSGGRRGRRGWAVGTVGRPARSGGRSAGRRNERKAPRNAAPRRAIWMRGRRLFLTDPNMQQMCPHAPGDTVHTHNGQSTLCLQRAICTTAWPTRAASLKLGTQRPEHAMPAQVSFMLPFL